MDLSHFIKVETNQFTTNLLLMNELWYDDLSLKSEDIKILPIKFEYLIGRHFKKWGVYFFTRFWKEVNLWKQKIKNQKVVPHSLRPSNIHSANKKERIGKNMELKFVIPNMEKTFGNLEFAGEDKVVQRRINGRLTVLSRSYNLYSDVQRADDIVVVLPAEAGEKHFGFEERVKLVNPRITAEGYKIGTRGFTNYLLHADDMVKE